MALHSRWIHVGNIGDTGEERENCWGGLNTPVPENNALESHSLSPTEMMPDRFPRMPLDGEAEPFVSEVTNSRCEFATQ